MPRYLAYRSTLTSRAQLLRSNQTVPEKKLWQFLRTLPWRFVRQKPLGSYIVDFYCASLMLAIEVDGDSHFSPEARDHDLHRSGHRGELGVAVLRLTNEDVMKRFAGTCAEILKVAQRHKS